MSITYKQLNRDTNGIIQDCKRLYHDKYMRVIETRNKLEAYYEINGDNIEKSALLRKHKSLTSDSEVINSNYTALIFGIMGSAFFQLCTEEISKEKSAQIESAIAFAIAIFVVMLLLMIMLYRVTKYAITQVYGYRTVYIDKFHADIIKNILFSSEQEPKDLQTNHINNERKITLLEFQRQNPCVSSLRFSINEMLCQIEVPLRAITFNEKMKYLANLFEMKRQLEDAQNSLNNVDCDKETKTFVEQSIETRISTIE